MLCRAADLAISLCDVSVEQPAKSQQTNPFWLAEFDSYLMGLSCFNSGEFQRAVFHLTNCRSSKAYFLKIYATYMVSNAVNLFLK